VVDLVDGTLLAVQDLGGSLAINNNNWGAIVFTTPSGGTTLRQASVYMDPGSLTIALTSTRTACAAQLIVCLRSWDIPTNTARAPPQTFTNPNAATGFATYNFSPFLALNASTRYALVFKSDAAGTRIYTRTTGLVSSLLSNLGLLGFDINGYFRSTDAGTTW
jgi:hypothetical protein